MPVLPSRSTASWSWCRILLFSRFSFRGCGASNVLCNTGWVLVWQSPRAHLVWGTVPLLCWNVWLRLQMWIFHKQHSTNGKKKKQKQSWYVDFPLYPGIICLEEGLCNGCRQSEQHKWEITHSGVVNTIFALSSGCRKHYYLIFFLQPRGILTCLKFSNTMPIWWHCTAIMKLEFCACSYFFLFPRAASCSFSC